MVFRASCEGTGPREVGIVYTILRRRDWFLPFSASLTSDDADNNKYIVLIGARHGSEHFI